MSTIRIFLLLALLCSPAAGGSKTPERAEGREQTQPAETAKTDEAAAESADSAEGIEGAAKRRNKPFIRPPFLEKGDTVAIIATSSMIPAKADTAKVRAQFAAIGLNVRFGSRSFFDSKLAYTQTDDARAQELQQALDDPNIKAIIPFCGGYGAVRILDKVDLSHLRQHPKWIAGYSDITMLHLALQKKGIESIHATMPTSFRYDSVDVSMLSLGRALFGDTVNLALPPHPYNRPGKASGRLVGGNLSLIHAAAATPADIDTDEPFVLLIEDVGEKAYRIDRMMQNLQHSGVLRRAMAILVGYFTNIITVKEFEPTADIYALIRSYTDPLGIPVLFGVPSGHQLPNNALYMGRRVEVAVGEEGAIIRFK